MSIRTTTNTDNAGLEPLGAGAFLIGPVDSVNGRGTLEVPKFVPTRVELLELAKHWERTFLDRTFFVFWSKQIGSAELRIGPFADRRVLRIIKLLGEDAIHAVREERDAFAKGIDPREWEEFRNYLGPDHLYGEPRA